jgi:hypothetical protein
MKIIDTYSRLQQSHAMKDAHPVFRAWEYTDADIRQWFKEISTPKMQETAQLYLKQVHSIVDQVENFFKTTLHGDLVLIPSMDQVDGFARYDLGHHIVMLGIDFPDASIEYLRALTAHELSHVFRDHAPDVWKFLKKPLMKVSRNEYLEATTAREHLVSEGLATLTSQTIFPEVPLHEHHYYHPKEMSWCLDHSAKINEALENCLMSPDPDPWQFYNSGVIAKNSPSHAHYYWAASKIDAWIKNTPGMTLLKAHTLSADQIDAF